MRHLRPGTSFRPGDAAEDAQFFRKHHRDMPSRLLSRVHPYCVVGQPEDPRVVENNGQDERGTALLLLPLGGLKLKLSPILPSVVP